MKKILLAFTIVASLIVNQLAFSTNTTSLNPLADTETTFAHIDSNTSLYQIPSQGNQLTVMTSLPATYFVEIIGEQGDYYQVGYLDIVGLVSKDSVTVVDYTPKYKFASPAIRISKDVTGVNIRTAPDDTNSTVIYTATSADTEFIYYGDVKGTSPIFGIDKWYFVRLIDDVNVFHGYVYSAYTIADSIPNNVIEAEPDDKNDSQNNSKPTLLQGTTLYIFIGALCIPAVLIIFLLFKKHSPKSRKKTE